MLEHLGNVNYSATGRKLGFSLPVLMTAASMVQWLKQLFGWIGPQMLGQLVQRKVPNLHWSSVHLEWVDYRRG